MDKSKIKFYRSKEEIEQNGENILKDWERYPDEEHIFTAIHKQSGIRLFVNEENGGIECLNWADWARHMSTDEKLSASEISVYQQRLVQEFGFWVKKEDERLNAEFERTFKQSEQAANAIEAFSPYVFENMQKKIKS